MEEFKKILDFDKLNMCLTDWHRKKYEPTIQYMFELIPDMMGRKIPRANVQQAFVLDTVKQLADSYMEGKNTPILSVGCYEDTATTCLDKLGYIGIGIDPVMNMDLNTFFENRGNNQFGIILSTSVIEHVPDDETFISQICQLLGPGGYGVLTMDFNNHWEPGKPKPGEDQRLYTQEDIEIRLGYHLLKNNCQLVGKTDYSAVPDFEYGGAKYSFATMVFKKND